VVDLRKPRFTLTFVLVLIAVAALASCSTTNEAVDPPNEQLQIGNFTMEVKKNEPDDIAQILGINRWKFTLQRDVEHEVGLEATLFIASPDEPAETIKEIRIFTDETRVEGLVAIYPLGESLFKADEVRVYMQLGSGSTSSVLPNPFKEFGSSYTANPADVLDRDSLRLMAFSDNAPMPSPENTVLSLNIEQFESE
jgi:hypothetical protein